MYKKITNWILALAFVATSGGALLATSLATVPAAAASKTSADCARPILTFPVWYRNLPVNDDCSLKGPDAGGLSAYVWTIVLNVIDILLQVVAYLSVFFIIYGGFQYITSAGSSEGTANGRKTITNAIIGLVISILSVAIVNIVAGAIS